MTYGFELVCRALEREGVRHVFGVPGTQSVHLYEGLRRSGLRTVLTASELGAAFAAGAYGRVSGAPGTLLTIPGPGFAYALPGLAEARLDSAPLVHLTWAPPSRGRPFDLQAIDQAAIAGPLVKRVIAIESADDIADGIHAAYADACAGEPGPILVQFSAHALTDERVDQSDGGTQAGPPPSLDREAAARAYARMRDAVRPVMLVGQGAAFASGALRALAERISAPVLTTPSGRGVLPEDHPLAIAFDVPRGDVNLVNALLAESDLVLVLGAKLGHNGSVGYALAVPWERAVRVDTSAEVLAESGGALTVLGDVETFLEEAPAPPAERGRGRSAEEVAAWRDRIRATTTQDVSEPTVHVRGGAAGLFAALRVAMPRDGIVACDSGLHQVMARRHYVSLAPNGLLLPSDFQSMGFGLPAAIGAKLAAPDRAVAAVIGDGSLGMTGFELATAVRERRVIPVIVFHDGKLNLIRVQQIGHWGRTHALDLPPLDLEAYAAGVGAGYRRVEGDMREPLEAALGAQGPTLLDVRVGDSLPFLTHRAVAAAKAGVRGLLPRGLLGKLKRMRASGR